MFTFVCKVDELDVGEALRIDKGPEPVALFNIDGEFHAIQDTCTHGNWSLAEGFVDGDKVECSLHMAQFCVRTGKVCAPPATLPAKVFPVRIHGEEVLVDLENGSVTA